ncbi:MAG TPA: cobyric acid synthase [Terriglobales bacterium]|jgi:adenosylcobyric acid synthase|nr:cobyric acid synthase [Terriglobales bacterium]
MPALRIMVQGTGSYVGKSVVTAALCRYFFKRGYRVAPFKAQNMSNNSHVTADGGEIGRAQAFQAAACGIEPTVAMNPVLLKPSGDMGTQVVVLGKPVAMMCAREYHQYQPQLIPIVQQSFAKLASEYDLVVIEGAGSPAEINLRRFDITNMAMAKLANAPVLLVGDIHVGGVFAWLVGTLELLQPDERALVKAFVINKFRGDLSLLDDGISFLEERTGKKTLGVLPFVPNLPVDEEDGVREPPSREASVNAANTLNVSVIRLPRISNSTDFEALANEPDVTLRYLSSVPESIQSIPDAVILPGTKSTVDDLAFLRSSGLETYLRWIRGMKVPLVGICGGFQMLGTRILDPGNVEASETATEGLGFLPVVTEFEARKQTVRVRGVSLQSGAEITGYEIHMGQTRHAEDMRPLFRISEEHGDSEERYEGCVSSDGLVWGTYIHGLFDSAAFRREFLNQLRVRQGWPSLIPQNTRSREADLDSLAALVSEHLDCEMLNEILTGKI